MLSAKQWEELLDGLQDVAGRAKLPALPGKKVFGNMEPKFLESRRRELQSWVAEIVRVDRLRESDALWRWLQPLPTDTEPLATVPSAEESATSCCA